MHDVDGPLTCILAGAPTSACTRPIAKAQGFLKKGNLRKLVEGGKILIVFKLKNFSGFAGLLS